MNVVVKLFAAARDRVEADQVSIEVAEGSTVAELRSALSHAHPSLNDILPHSMIAINADYATDATPVTPDSEIACIPPVSGG